MVPESSYEILPGTIHRFCAASDDVSILEVSTPEIDDVIRLSDDYIR
jgi:D-lyxose ketol-isomerase